MGAARLDEMQRVGEVWEWKEWEEKNGDKRQVGPEQKGGKIFFWGRNGREQAGGEKKLVGEEFL